MDADERVYARMKGIAAEITAGGEYYFWIKDAPACLEALVCAGLACIGIDGFVKENGGHMEPLVWIFDGSPEDHPFPDWEAFRCEINDRARTHLAKIEADGAHGCSFVAIDEREWHKVVGGEDCP